jgi:orotate phosphoribosyltransferase
VAASVAISELYDKEIGYCSNRKEVKDHGDKGILLGTPIEENSRIVIIEDVTTAGTSIGETLPIIREQAAGASVIGLVVSVDRMERGQGEKSALQEISEVYGFPTTAIVTMAEVVEHLHNRPYNGKVYIDDTLKAAIDAYYEQWGVK